ncbi:MAG: DUF5522 domain-containing protein [bacterium]
MTGPLPQDRIIPHPSRCDPARADYAEIVRRHGIAIERGLEAYPDPATGYQVWTAEYLWKRGYCCDSGCRHCPYVER